MSLPEVVQTVRLRLPLWDAAVVADLRAGHRRAGWHPDFPRGEDRDAATLWRAGDPWGPRSVVRGVTVLGSIGFYGAPSAGADGRPEAEVGYGLVEQARGWGFATEALTGLLVHTDAAGVRVRAAVAPANRPGLRVLTRAGFTDLRGADEDDHLVLARPVPVATGG